MSETPDQIQAKTVVAQSFVLTDAGGGRRAAMVLSESGQPVIALFDNRGVMRAELGLTNDQPQLTLYDDAGQPRLVLAVSDNMSAIALNHAASAGDVGVYVKATGPAVALSHSAEHVLKAMLGVDADGDPTLRMCDSRGAERVTLAFTPTQSPFLTLTDPDGGGVSLEPPRRSDSADGGLV